MVVSQVLDRGGKGVGTGRRERQEDFVKRESCAVNSMQGPDADIGMKGDITYAEEITAGLPQNDPTVASEEKERRKGKQYIVEGAE